MCDDGVSKGHDRTIVLRKPHLGYQGEVAHQPRTLAGRDVERKLREAPEIVNSHPGAPNI
jgi:hypothetical protein